MNDDLHLDLQQDVHDATQARKDAEKALGDAERWLKSRILAESKAIVSLNNFEREKLQDVTNDSVK